MQIETSGSVFHNSNHNKGSGLSSSDDMEDTLTIVNLLEEMKEGPGDQPKKEEPLE